MSATPLVSVVVPTHDRAGIVGRAVQSALAQTVEDLEVLVVDDGSTDGTPSVLAELAACDTRVRPIRLDRPRGAPAARNRGIDEAVGRFVAFLDDDDEWLPHKLERQLAVMDQDPSLVLVSCHHALVDDRGREHPYRGPTSCTAAQLRWADFLGGSSLGVVRRAAFPGGLPRFDPELRTCQDWDYWVRCADAGPVAVVPEVLCRYAAGDGDRLTNDAAKREAGHRRFLAKHAASMSRDCRAYLDARIALMAAGSQAREWALGPRLVRTLPPRVSWILATEVLAARAGARAGDPGRGLRRLHRAIGARP